MTNWSVVLLAYLTVLYILSRLVLRVSIQFQSSGSKGAISVTIYMYNVVLYRIGITNIELDYKQLPYTKAEVIARSKKYSTNSNRERKFLKRALKLYLKNPNILRKTYRTIRWYTLKYRTFLNKISKYLICEKLYWRTVLGIDDAAVTGMVVGLLWVIKSYLIKSLSNRAQVITKPQINITPKFNYMLCEVEFQCIFSIRVGNVINAAVTALINNNKGDRRWLNTRFKD